MKEEELKREFYDFANPPLKGAKQSDDIHAFCPRIANIEIADWWLNKLSEVARQTEEKMIEKIRADVIEIRRRLNNKLMDKKFVGNMVEDMDKALDLVLGLRSLSPEASNQEHNG